MTMKRFLQCVLVSIVLATVGCSLWADSDSTAKNSDSSRDIKSPTPQAPPKFAELDAVIKSIESLKGRISDEPDLTPRQATVDLDKALTLVGRDEVDSRRKCTNCAPEILTNLQEAREALNGAKTILNKEEGQKIKAKSDLQAKLLDASQALSTAKSSIEGSSPTPTPSSTAISKSTPPPGDTIWGLSISNVLMMALAVAAGLLVLFLLFMGVQHLRAQSKRNLEAQLAKVAGAQIAATKETHKELADRLTTLTATQKEISNGLLDVHTEVRSLARLMRESSADRNDRRHASAAVNYQAQMEDSLKDEPEFPVSADDYLGKMNRYANIVRPDFQNGILVNDPEGKGELMLIRDSRLADDAQPLFVVPRATHFQTKQDFHTYYEKYYDCARPTAGDVWILGPAVVEKVTGGWRLREKGMLEIR